MAEWEERAKLPSYNIDANSRGKCSNCKTAFMSSELTPPDKNNPDVVYCERCMRLKISEKEKLEEQKKQETQNERNRIHEEAFERERRKRRCEAQKRYIASRNPEELREKQSEYKKRRYQKKLEITANQPVISLFDGKDLKCPACGSFHIWKSGISIVADKRIQRYQCRDCLYTFTQGWDEE